MVPRDTSREKFAGLILQAGWVCKISVFPIGENEISSPFSFKIFLGKALNLR